MVAQEGIEQWLQLIRSEYLEMPGLHLTKPQVQRLFGIDKPTCDAVLAALEAVKFLRRTPQDGYVRADNVQRRRGMRQLREIVHH